MAPKRAARAPAAQAAQTRASRRLRSTAAGPEVSPLRALSPPRRRRAASRPAAQEGENSTSSRPQQQRRAAKLQTRRRASRQPAEEPLAGDAPQEAGAEPASRLLEGEPAASPTPHPYSYTYELFPVERAAGIAAIRAKADLDPHYIENTLYEQGRQLEAAQRELRALKAQLQQQEQKPSSPVSRKRPAPSDEGDEDEQRAPKLQKLETPSPKRATPMNTFEAYIAERQRQQEVEKQQQEWLAAAFTQPELEASSKPIHEHTNTSHHSLPVTS